MNNATLQSGQRFRYTPKPPEGFKFNPEAVFYRLQKLPDFPLWILIQCSTLRHWTGPADTPLGAFGGHAENFTYSPA